MRVGIIGFGRFGQLTFKVLQQHLNEVEIKVYSPNDKIDSERFFELDEVIDSDIIIPAVPISEFENVIKQISSKIKKDALLMDICSVKIHPVQVMEKFLPKENDILATHPMFGPDSSENGQKLEGLQFVYYPIRITNKKRYESILQFLLSLKLKLIKITPDDHDKQTAYTQQFAFFVGEIGFELNVSKNEVTTKGFENGILYNQIAMKNDSEQLFRDMQNFNPYTKEMRKKFIDAAIKIDKELGSDAEV